MNAINAAATAAKSTIDRLLSNGNTDQKGGLIRDNSWKTYSEDFSGNEISVNYRREGKTWIYTVTSDAADSTFFCKTGTARTLKEARLEALDAVVAGCTAQNENAKNGAKEELLKLMQGENHQEAIEAVLGSGLMPKQWLRRWVDIAERRAIQCGQGQNVSPEWREWADSRLAGKVTAIDNGIQWQKEFLWRTVEAAGRAAWNSKESLPCGERADAWKSAEDAERQQQHRDLLALINEM